MGLLLFPLAPQLHYVGLQSSGLPWVVEAPRQSPSQVNEPGRDGQDQESSHGGWGESEGLGRLLLDRDWGLLLFRLVWEGRLPCRGSSEPAQGGHKESDSSAALGTLGSIDLISAETQCP